MIAYDLVRRKANVLGKCPVCNRYVRRVTWFEEPVLGDKEDAIRAVEQRIAEYNPDLTHQKCRERQ